jgi:hypothetical protein
MQHEHEQSEKLSLHNRLGTTPRASAGDLENHNI